MPTNLLDVPHIEQQHSADCLAACAAMLLAHTNISVSYSHLLRILNIQSFGAPGRNLTRLSQIGVEVVYREGSMGTLEELIEGKRPCITLVRTEFLPYWAYSTDHAVVVVGIDSHHVFLNDPAFFQSPMRVARPQFELAWMEFNYRYCVMNLYANNR